ncbi:MAG: 2-C-methyl-D-erythritol 4-phosphate cytidylyltransferase, partial [Rikenellaceae bacterium]
HIALWKNLCKKHNCDIQHTIIEGGKSRTCSVRNGLSCIEHKDGVVLIHDAVRPLATKTLLTNVLHAAEKYNAAIPVIDITDSLRKIEAEESHAVEREQYKAVQTPQGFNLELIRKAYHNAKEKEFTDDAALLESIGVKIALVDGEKTNIKITTPEDMVIARSILKKQIKI